jgi:hypothetical protein
MRDTHALGCGRAALPRRLILRHARTARDENQIRDINTPSFNPATASPSARTRPLGPSRPRFTRAESPKEYSPRLSDPSSVALAKEEAMPWVQNQKSFVALNGRERRTLKPPHQNPATPRSLTSLPAREAYSTNYSLAPGSSPLIGSPPTPDWYSLRPPATNSQCLAANYRGYS